MGNLLLAIHDPILWCVIDACVQHTLSYNLGIVIVRVLVLERLDIVSKFIVK